MFDRKMIFALTMSFLTIFVLNYFFKGSKTGYDAGQPSVRSGQLYQLLSREELRAQEEQAQLISREVDFRDSDLRSSVPEQLTAIKTDILSLQFSTYGGTIASIAYPQRRDQLGVALQSITHKEIDQRDNSCLLLALQEETPFLYQLIDQAEDHMYAYITYATTWKEWDIRKTYRIDKQTHRIQLELACSPKGDAPTPLQARLLFPSPYLKHDKEGGAFFAGMAEQRLKMISDQDMQSVTQLPSLLGVHDKYFAHALTTDHNGFAYLSYFKRSNELISAIAAAKPIVKATSWKLDFYFGPKDLSNLIAVDKRLEGLLNFGMFGFLAKWLLAFLTFLYGFLGNYGLAIIVLTLLIKLPLLPLSIKAGRVQEQQKRYAPHIARIRQQYRNDPQRMMAELSRFHKEHGISPAAPVIGCLPLLIDIPIMFALWNVLANYVDLYKAPFFGWIVDLSAPDPYYVLPILMGLAMFWQQRMTPVMDNRMKVAGLFGTLFFTVVSINFAAGLVLYWLVKNLFGIVEHYIRKATAS